MSIFSDKVLENAKNDDEIHHDLKSRITTSKWQNNVTK